MLCGLAHLNVIALLEGCNDCQCHRANAGLDARFRGRREVG